MYRTLAIALVALALVGCATSGNPSYGELQTAMRGNDKIRTGAIALCIQEWKKESRADQELIAALAGTSVAAMPRTICSRVINAWKSGRLTEQDMKSTLRGNPSPNAIRVMRG